MVDGGWWMVDGGWWMIYIYSIPKFWSYPILGKRFAPGTNWFGNIRMWPKMLNRRYPRLVSNEIAALLLQPIAEDRNVWIGASGFWQVGEVTSRRKTDIGERCD